MRALVLSLALAAAASPAAAQLSQFEIDNLRAQQEAAARRAVAQENELMALEARLRADQAVADLQAGQRYTPRLPQLPYPQAPNAGASAAAKSYPSMSDAALADSNRRVQDAANNRR